MTAQQHRSPRAQTGQPREHLFRGTPEQPRRFDDERAPAVREGLDFAAANRRATLRFRAAERRRNVMNAIESAVTALIGVGFAVCVALTLTML